LRFSLRGGFLNRRLEVVLVQEADLDQGLSDGGKRHGIDEDVRPVGDGLRGRDHVEVARRSGHRAGLLHADLQILDSVSENIPVQRLAALAGTLMLRDYVEADLARIDPTATEPAKRILPAQLAILTPDVPDTLLLTEITG